LSQLLNDNNGTSFKQYVAQLRVSETQRLLLDQPGQTLEAIAEAAGFQSLSTFYAAFKKANGCTPALFRERHLAREQRV
jgi:AraC-like DNA-binding protein